MIESIVQKVMAKPGFGCRFNNLKYFVVGFFSYFLN